MLAVWGFKRDSPCLGAFQLLNCIHFISTFSLFFMFITTFVHPLWSSVVLLLRKPSEFLLPLLLLALKCYSKTALYTAECLEIGINRRESQVWQHSTMQSISAHTCCSLNKNQISPLLKSLYCLTSSMPGLWGKAFTCILLFMSLSKGKTYENQQSLINIQPKKESNHTKCRCST